MFNYLYIKNEIILILYLNILINLLANFIINKEEVHLKNWTVISKVKLNLN